MDMRGNQYNSCDTFVDLHPVKMTSPTCEDLGIPTDVGEDIVYPLFARRILHTPSLHLDSFRYEADVRSSSDPYSPVCMIPLPGTLTLHSGSEPNFIRKRNERERERVRCVNEGYERLKDHLPLNNRDKRISKVETLRGAIDYIRQLQELLAALPKTGATTEDKDDENEEDNDENGSTKSAQFQREGALEWRSRASHKRPKSLSPERSLLSDFAHSESEENSYKKRRVNRD